MTQLETLQAAFDRGEILTVGNALGKYGIYALSQRVGELKRQGYPIVSEMVSLPSGKRVAFYRKNITYDVSDFLEAVTYVQSPSS